MMRSLLEENEGFLMHAQEIGNGVQDALSGGQVMSLLFMRTSRA